MSRWWKSTTTDCDVQASRFERELAEAKRQYEEMMQQQRLIASQSMSASSSTWPPDPLAIDEIKENAVAKAQASAREAQIKLQDLQRAVSSIVLRLKVLDVEALEKDLGEDGTVPLRLALSELRQLLAAYDGMPKNSIPDYLTYATTTAPYYYNTTGNAYYTSSNTGGNIP